MTAAIAMCAGARCRSRTRNGQTAFAAGASGRWCRACRNDAGRDLQRVPHLYAESALALSATGPGEQCERSSPSPVASMPINAAVVDARRATVDVLASWAGLVVAQRGVGAPPRRPAALAAFLERHLDWLAGHPAAPELSEELAGLVRRLHQAAYARESRQVRLGVCVEHGCNGSLVAVLHAPGHGSGTEIVCRAVPTHRWSERQWLELSRRMSGQPGPQSTAERWFSAADIARLWHTSCGTVYRLASEQRWRRRTAGGRTRYAEADVRRTFQDRARRSLDAPEPCEEATYQHPPQ